MASQNVASPGNRQWVQNKTKRVKMAAMNDDEPAFSEELLDLYYSALL
jgi:hypothetical protein